MPLVAHAVRARALGRRDPEPLIQFRPSPTPRDILYRYGNGFPLPNEHDELLAAGHSGVEKVSLQHGVVLSQNWDDDGRVFRALAFVDGDCISWHQGIEFAKSIRDDASVEIGDQL